MLVNSDFINNINNIDANQKNIIIDKLITIGNELWLLADSIQDVIENTDDETVKKWFYALLDTVEFAELRFVTIRTLFDGTIEKRIQNCKTPGVDESKS